MLKQFWRLNWVSLASAIVVLPAIIATPSAQAQTEILLHSFRNTPDGANPQAGLIRDAAGNLYGTTYYGGTGHCSGHACGVVFKVAKAGKETVLYTFNGTDGAQPLAGLVRDKAGNLYGTTSAGGASDLGTVFKLDPAGHETVLHSFTGSPDGRYPCAALILDPEGDLYGTTAGGGTSDSGTVFEMDTAGKESVLYSFTGGADGNGPSGSLIRDRAGNLYGTTYDGGAFALGTVFQLDTTGNETVLHSFGSGEDGQHPDAGLVQDAVGSIYGTTFWGGDSGLGTVFKLDTNRTESVLYSFTGEEDGAHPSASLVLDKANDLYGTAVEGGDLTCGGGTGCGTVFKLDSTGEETVLHSFAGNHGNPRDGTYPEGSLVRDAAGNLYGTTYSGGKYRSSSYNVGTVFKLSP
jgi:uncharacterized repeat protein (TIGR03803 family)